MSDTKMFKELKKKCLEVREKYKNNPGDYYQSKVNYVNYIKNPVDAYILINMFDTENQRDLWNRLSTECREYYKKYFYPYY